MKIIIISFDSFIYIHFLAEQLAHLSVFIIIIS